MQPRRASRTLLPRHAGIIAPMPQQVRPMLAKLSVLPENDTDFAYELKWDGIRAIAYIADKKLTLESRNQLNITFRYPEFHTLANAIHVQSAVLDGEIIALTEQGVPSFEKLQERMGLMDGSSIHFRMRAVPAHYMIFDLLYLNGRSLANEPYAVRRQLLEGLQLDSEHWKTPPSRAGTGACMLEFARAHQLEGIIAKRLDSKYELGLRTGAWRKIKIAYGQEFVIGGWSPGEGGRAGRIGSLLMGCYDYTPMHAKKLGVQQQLLYAGKVGTGFSEAMLDKLAALLAPLRQDTNPFAARHPEHRRAHFVEPQYVAECSFYEWTRDGRLRHPVFKGLRPDKPAIEVVREEISPRKRR
jgi:bifunctional non-homologous end joining protein LigD